MDIKYRLIFRGYKEGISEIQAKESLGKIFNLSIESVQTIFAKPGQAVKSRLALDDAVRYQKTIDTAGAICSVEPDQEYTARPEPMGVPQSNENEATFNTRQTKQCETCAKIISVLADRCPSCGAPNDWIHPNIERLISQKDATGLSETFTFQWKRAEVWGETKLKIPWWAWLIFLFTAPISAFGSIVVGVLITVVCAAVLFPLVGKKHTFRANLQTRSWESSDDKFWRPIRSILGIQTEEDNISTDDTKGDPVKAEPMKSLQRPRRHS